MAAKITEVYLGDSVYARIENGGVLLYLNNGLGPKDSIFLEPETYAALVKFVSNL